MGYRLSQKAAQDVLNIFLYGAGEFGIIQAEKYHTKLGSIFDHLSTHPHITRERDNFSPRVCIHPFGSHIVIYVLRGKDILIVRVLGGRQDWERYL